MIKHSHKIPKRLGITAGAVIAFLSLTGCTKSFITNQDKANQLYAFYGDIFADSTAVTNPDAENDNVTSQNSNRTALFTQLTTTGGYSLPTRTFNAYMSKRVENEALSTYQYFQNGVLDSIEDENQAKLVATHVAMYTGINYDADHHPTGVADVMTNFTIWYEEGLTEGTITVGFETVEKPGALLSPSVGYVAAMKTQFANKLKSNPTGITPKSGVFNQNGSNVYLQGKSWGQSFKDYGFLEGLFVWPLAYIVHSISTGLGGTPGAILLAILVVTLLVRLVTVISTVFQTKTQSKQQALQPQIQALQKKYPNSQTDPQERRAMALEQSKLMKSAGVHPFLPFLFLIIQFPLFVCIWSALQGSAALASGSFFGLYLVTPVSQCFTAYKTTPGAYIGIIIFVVMTLANILSSASSLWFNNWRTKKFGNPMAAQQSANGTDPSKMGKYMTYGMMIFVVIMGWSLPAGMGIYWFISAVISIVQTVMMEAIQAHHRHQLSASTGDGSTLAAMRRSRHHQYDSSKKMKRQEKKSGSDKPLWR